MNNHLHLPDGLTFLPVVFFLAFIVLHTVRLQSSVLQNKYDRYKVSSTDFSIENITYLSFLYRETNLNKKERNDFYGKKEKRTPYRQAENLSGGV